MTIDGTAAVDCRFMPASGRPFRWTVNDIEAAGDVVKVDLAGKKTRFVPTANLRFVEPDGEKDKTRYPGRPLIVDLVYLDGKKSKWYARSAAIREGLLDIVLLDGTKRFVPVAALRWFTQYAKEDAGI